MLKIGPYCIPCSIRQVVDEVLIATEKQELRERVIRKALDYLSRVSWETTPLLLSINLQKIIWKETGNYDPYWKLKKESTEHALKYLPKIKELIEKQKTTRERLKIALKAALAGNVIDFGANPNFNLAKTIDRILSIKLPSSVNQFVEEILNAKSVCFLGDNAGEIVFDRVLIEEMLHAGVKNVVFYVKGNPMLNDAMKEDAIESGIDKVAKIKEIPLDGNDQEILETLYNVARECKKFDIQVSKGQANFEIFHQEPFWFVLLVKCPEISRKTQKSIGDTIIKKGPFMI